MKYKAIIILLLCNLQLKSQDEGVELPNSLGFPVYGIAKERVLAILKEVEQYSPDELTSKSKWQYHLTLSSCKLYSGRDSSLYHFNLANEIDPSATCNVMRPRHNTFIKLLEEEKDNNQEHAYIKVIKEETGDSVFSWFLWDIPNFDEYAFIDSCDKNYPPKIIDNEVRDTTLISETIRKNDQKFRTRGMIEEQLELDELNRIYIDSIFALKISLDNFKEEEIYQISMVVHHSEDCGWTYEWTERLIDHYMTGYEGSILLGPLLERMFDKNDGFCTKQDVQKREYFIYKLKNKYPTIFEKLQLKW